MIHRAAKKKKNMVILVKLTIIKVLDVCYRVGVLYITIYAFSIENFNRSLEEVDTLFGLLRDRLKLLCENDDSYASVNKVRIKVIGNRGMIPHDILKDLETIEDKTNTPMVNKVLYVGFPYTSRDDITHSIRRTVDQLNLGEIRRDQIDLEMLQKNMYMGADAPQLDLLVRTSGHTRLSDFMLWQCNANCTIEFVRTLWPDFKFLSIASLLFKWSYYKTLQLQVESAAAEVPHDAHEPTDIFNQLPPPPPFASVTQRQL